ncbi:hypothetical protein P691DRAFT_708350 [Macrolepiota fuliginosa MF-IS2]|uniref:XPG-I domain-containing protein n=1 Tax=Macrolepiota fuliginosa MF-IS2 TaxID=1400762 RepID=A0A9P5XAZ2_9AGAR|nr:hypothetical protein P691DRAFT_708350 [Macrolepiota fuliginosa MF-IS2]
MGVAGLWDILKPAATTRSLTELAVAEGFQANPRGLRGYRIGIDASIWFFHAEYGKEGENPVLRTLFFRCATLTKAPFLPLFVFDGPKRPDFKRGKRINKTGNKLIPGMKRIVEAFGFEWRTAPGEAEAELAYLNRIGVIDGILSDDVDNFLFGAMTVIRNQSNNLSGNKANPVLNSEGRDDKNHTRVFRFQDIHDHPDIQLTRGGLILIGLMSGGDYEGGLERCGVATAHALARCGFGDSLYEAACERSRDGLALFLDNWRQELRHELKTNSRGFMNRKSIALSKSVPDTFPNIDVLLSYVQPVTSESLGHEGANPKITWSKEPNVAALAAACELFFEWGYKEAIIKRFRTVIWPGVMLRILRRAALEVDSFSSIPSTPHKSRPRAVEEDSYGTPSKMIAKYFSAIRLDDHSSSDEESDEASRLIISISRERTHASTDGLPEYRLEVAPEQLVQMAESGLQGLRQPEGPGEWASDEEEEEADDEGGRARKGEGKGPIDPTSHLRLWMPTCMVDIVEKKLVRDFKDTLERKKQKKRAPTKKKAAPPEQSDPRPRKTKPKGMSCAPRAASQHDSRTGTSDDHISRISPKLRPHPLSSAIDARKEEEEESSDDEGELPVISAPKRTTTAPVRKSAPRSTSTSKISRVAAIFDPPPSISSIPSPKTIEDTLALSDLDEDLPAGIYRTIQPKPTKQSTSSTNRGYIIISDDDDHLTKPVSPTKRTKATNKNKPATQKTLSSYMESRKLTGGRSEASDTHEPCKSPRKSKAHISPRQKGSAVAKKSAASKDDDSIISVSDEDSDVGYPGVSRPSIAPLQLARARAKKKSKPSISPPRSSVEYDVIDLT